MIARIGRIWFAAVLLLTTLSAASPAFAETPANRDQLAARVLELVNQERAREGLAPMAMNPNLTTAAQSYAETLSSGGCFEHTCGPVPNPGDRIRNTGYSGYNAWAENIAAGQRTPEEVMKSWMNSPGHRANIMNPIYNEIGVGVSNGAAPYRIYWSQSFARRPAASAPAPTPTPTPVPPAFQPIFPTEPAPTPAPPVEAAPEEPAPVEEAPPADELPVEEPALEEA